ncbi:MAG: amino acid ABC transporter substrate-binding protein [Gammaproteobacteria bacterium]
MSPKSDSNASPATIRIGIAVSLSGRYALLGQQVLAGLQCYVADVNATGGIRVTAKDGPRPVELLVRDDRGDVLHCERQVHELIGTERIDLLMGPYGSGLTFAAAKVAESRRMVLWNHSGSGDQIFSAGFRMVVGIISPASNYLCSVLELVRACDSSARKVALVSAETGFAEDVAAGVVAWVEREGFTLVEHQRYTSGYGDFVPIVNSLARHQPDCVLGVGRLEDDLRLARDMVALRLPAKAVGLVVAGIDKFRDELGTEVAGFMAPSQWESDTRYKHDCGPAAEEFVASYVNQQSQPLDYPAAQGYVGGLIAQKCIEIAETLEQTELRAAANALNCTTFYGPYSIDPESGRQIGHAMLVTQWREQHRCIVWPPQAATAEVDYPGPFWPDKSST